MKKTKLFSIFIVFLLIVSCSSEEKKPEKSIEIEKEIKISPPKEETITKIQKNESVIDTTIIESPIMENNVENIGQKAKIKDETESTKEESSPIVPEIKEEIIIEDYVNVMAPIRASHEGWNILLNKYVASNGDVDYKKFKPDSEQLKLYLIHLSEVSPTSEWNKNEKLAYWINLYNAATVKLILDNYPVKSITEINNGKPWDLKFVSSGGKFYSLNQIENDIIRPRFKEPKIHVAVNCAAISCPPLMNSAFIPEKLKSQLTKRAKSFINNPNNNTIATDKIEVSKIFEWYITDFEKDGGVIGFINKYSDKSVSQNATITYLEYNWNLNEK